MSTRYQQLRERDRAGAIQNISTDGPVRSRRREFRENVPDEALDDHNENRNENEREEDDDDDEDEEPGAKRTRIYDPRARKKRERTPFDPKGWICPIHPECNWERRTSPKNWTYFRCQQFPCPVLCDADPQKASRYWDAVNTKINPKWFKTRWACKGCREPGVAVLIEESEKGNDGEMYLRCAKLVGERCNTFYFLFEDPPIERRGFEDREGVLPTSSKPFHHNDTTV